MAVVNYLTRCCLPRPTPRVGRGKTIGIGPLFMNEQTWTTSANLNHLVDYVLRGRVSIRRLRTFAIACHRLVWDKMQVAEAVELIERVEQYNNRQVEWEEVSQSLTKWHARLVNLRCEWETLSFPAIIRAAAMLGELANNRSSAIVHSCHPVLTMLYGADYDSSGQAADLLRCVLGNLFQPKPNPLTWKTTSVCDLAKSQYITRTFNAMPILADALEEAGCDHAEVLAHCRDPALTHVRGCWVVDLVLGKN